MDLRKDDLIMLDIKRLGINGEGIGYYKRLAIFVKNAIPGEGIKVRITEVKDNMAYGVIDAISHKSKDRVNPPCIYYEECGGCQVQHINYNKMLEYKREILMESISRYTTLNPYTFEVKKTLGMEDPWHYRNKSSLLIKRFGETTSVCMIQEESNIFFPIETCLVQDDVLNTINNKIAKIVDEMHISTYNSKSGKGILKYVSLRVTSNKKDVLACFVCMEKDDIIKKLAIEVMKIDGIKGVYENIATEKTIGVFGDITNYLCGDRTIIDEVGPYKYNLYPTTFFQLNPTMTKVMFEEIKKATKLSFKETVLDAYCGVGAIGIYISKLAKEVVGIEYSKDSINEANENVKLNKIKNATFHQGDVAQLLPKMLEDGKVFDVIVVDPPRVGLGEELITSLLLAKAKRLVYVSCNPSTFAKDLSKLSEIYNVKYIQPIDMFPQTAHVESVALLELKKN